MIGFWVQEGESRRGLSKEDRAASDRRKSTTQGYHAKSRKGRWPQCKAHPRQKKLVAILWQEGHGIEMQSLINILLLMAGKHPRRLFLAVSKPVLHALKPSRDTWKLVMSADPWQ